MARLGLNDADLKLAIRTLEAEGALHSPVSSIRESARTRTESEESFLDARALPSRSRDLPLSRQKGLPDQTAGDR
jgi:hypothetical protein